MDEKSLLTFEPMSDSEDPFHDFEDFCQRVSESDPLPVDNGHHKKAVEVAKPSCLPCSSKSLKYTKFEIKEDKEKPLMNGEASYHYPGKPGIKAGLLGGQGTSSHIEETKITSLNTKSEVKLDSKSEGKANVNIKEDVCIDQVTDNCKLESVKDINVTETIKLKVESEMEKSGNLDCQKTEGTDEIEKLNEASKVGEPSKDESNGNGVSEQTESISVLPETANEVKTSSTEESSTNETDVETNTAVKDLETAILDSALETDALVDALETSSAVEASETKDAVEASESNSEVVEALETSELIEALETSEAGDALENNDMGEALENNDMVEALETKSTDKALEADATVKALESDATFETVEADATVKELETDATFIAVETDATIKAEDTDTIKALENDATIKAEDTDTIKALENDATIKAEDTDTIKVLDTECTVGALDTVGNAETDIVSDAETDTVLETLETVNKVEALEIDATDKPSDSIEEALESKTLSKEETDTEQLDNGAKVNALETPTEIEAMETDALVEAKTIEISETSVTTSQPCSAVVKPILTEEDNQLLPDVADTEKISEECSGIPILELSTPLDEVDLESSTNSENTLPILLKESPLVSTSTDEVQSISETTEESLLLESELPTEDIVNNEIDQTDSNDTNVPATKTAIESPASPITPTNDSEVKIVSSPVKEQGVTKRLAEEDCHSSKVEAKRPRTDVSKDTAEEMPCLSRTRASKRLSREPRVNSQSVETSEPTSKRPKRKNSAAEACLTNGIAEDKTAPVKLRSVSPQKSDETAPVTNGFADDKTDKNEILENGSVGSPPTKRPAADKSEIPENKTLETSQPKQTVLETSSTLENGTAEPQPKRATVKVKDMNEILTQPEKSSKKKISFINTNLDALMDGKKEILVNRDLLEDLVMIKVTEYLADKGNIGSIRVMVQKLEDELERIKRQNINYQKQFEDARRVIKRLIDEKMNKSGTNQILPPRVTRSVGLQVCLCGSMQVKTPRPANSSQPAAGKVPTGKVLPEPKAAERPIGKAADKPTPKAADKPISTPLTTRYVPIRPNPVQQAAIIQSPIIAQTPPTNRAVQRLNPHVLTVQKTIVQPIQQAMPRQNARKSTTNLSIKSPVMPYSPANIVSARPMRPIVKQTLQSLAARVPAGIQIRPAPAPTLKSSSEVIDLTEKDDIQEAPAKTIDAQNPSFQIQISSARTDSARDTNHQADSTPITPEVGVTLKTADLVKKLTSLNKSSELEATTPLLPYPPLPKAPPYSPKISRPPRPLLRICRSQQPGRAGIMLSWNFTSDEKRPLISKYQVYAYQEGGEEGKDTWKKVGDVDALPLPMACTLTQFKDGFQYHFAVRAIDNNMRVGEFSLPGSIKLHPPKRASQNGR